MSIEGSLVSAQDSEDGESEVSEEAPLNTAAAGQMYDGIVKEGELDIRIHTQHKHFLTFELSWKYCLGIVQVMLKKAMSKYVLTSIGDVIHAIVGRNCAALSIQGRLCCDLEKF